ncbi:hypothetical protein B7755_002910 [Streptomyces sp. NBS 14/10]|uniref:hypothetical protein n=1 Tax=Streptomyces sp. NBS 14/10 TaxID=1945643 RepID=UPI0015C61890|nr:hypothetical protein [Streptomyces sp. NBS 14/10]KAK1177202.1 hypothetical protein B7755_002910 [Streptomyces sp. NBS 14/10]
MITGARGGIDAGLLRRLHVSGHDVRAASRAPERLDLPAGALDLADPTTFAPALVGVTDVFLYAECSGWYCSHRTRRSSPNAEHNALAHHHLQVERAPRATPLTATVLRPGE